MEEMKYLQPDARAGVPLRFIASILLVSLLAAPAVLATSAYERDGRLGPSAVVAGTFDDYHFSASAGQVITATATWDPSQGNLALSLRHVTSTLCAVTDVPCVSRQVAGVVEDQDLFLLCGAERQNGFILTGPAQTVTLVAPATGDYELTVTGGVIPSHLDYHLSLDVDAAAPSVTYHAGSIGAGSEGGAVCALT